MSIKAAGYIVFDTWNGELRGAGYTQAQAFNDAVMNNCDSNVNEDERKSYVLGLTPMRATWSLMEQFQNEGADFHHEVDGVACTAEEYYYGER